jgi:hypothetical protein
MATLTQQELKKALAQAGFLVFRTVGDDIILAERVRENLIMDSGVRLRASSPFEVRIVLRAQRGDFQNEEEASLFDRVSHLAEPARAAGFVEVERNIAPVIDPGDASRTLDTFYEITLSKEADSLERAVEGLHFAMTLEKMATAKPA